MNKQITKKVVATFTSVATVAMLTAGAFLPMAAGAADAGLMSCWSLEESGEPCLDSVDSNNLLYELE